MDRNKFLGILTSRNKLLSMSETYDLLDRAVKKLKLEPPDDATRPSELREEAEKIQGFSVYPFYGDARQD